MREPGGREDEDNNEEGEKKMGKSKITTRRKARLLSPAVSS